MTRVIEIDDATDPRLRRYVNLRSNLNKGYNSDSFIVEGRWCVQRLIESGHTILSVLVERGKSDEVAPWLTDATPLYSLPPEQIRQLVGFDFHRGMLACGKRPPLRTTDQLEFGPGSAPLALAVLGVNEEENLGSIVRTAAALGIDNLLVGPKTADPYARRSIRVSMATIFQQKVHQLDRPDDQLAELQRARNIRTIVTTLDRDATPLSELARDDRDSILILGNEAEGIGRPVQSIATDRVTIPMLLGTDSLNVSVAAAIFMYELLRLRPRGAQNRD